MKHSKYFVTILASIVLSTGLFSVERDQALLTEDFASPNVANFDCHSSSIIETSPGVLCAVWKGGPGQGKSNIDIKQNVGIWMSQFKNGTWSMPEQIIESPDSVCWTPILTQCPNGEIKLFYRIGPDPRQTVSLVITSFDQGAAWSEPTLLPAGIVGPTKAKPVFDLQGNMICGSSVEVGSPINALKATACWIEILSSDGEWSKSGPIEIPGRQFGCIEPSLFWTSKGTLKLVCRDRSYRVGLDGWIWTAESTDLGHTWSALTKTTLPNPDSGIATLSLDQERTLLFFNNSWTNRYPLTVAISSDDGNSWTPLFNIEETSGEFPSATLDSEGNVHVIYAYTQDGNPQRRIKHIVLDTHKMLEE